MNGESSINIYTLLCVKQMAGEKLLYNTGSPAWHSVMTQRDAVEAGEGGDMCIIMADLWYCMAEINTAL